jgi:hypothetical protein
MRESLPTKLLLMLAEATPDMLAAVERFLQGEPLQRAFAPANEAGVAEPVETPDPLCYTLRREPACWVLVFQGRRAYLKYEIGLAYVAYLLSHPDQRVSGTTLFSKFHPQSPKASGISHLVSPDGGEITDLPDDARRSMSRWDKRLSPRHFNAGERGRVDKSRQSRLKRRSQPSLSGLGLDWRGFPTTSSARTDEAKPALPTPRPGAVRNCRHLAQRTLT